MSIFEKLRNFLAKKSEKMGSLHNAAVSKMRKTGSLQTFFRGLGQLRKIFLHFLEKMEKKIA